MDVGHEASDRELVSIERIRGASDMHHRGGVFRKVYWFESDRIRRHLLRLGPEDRLLRFGGGQSDRSLHDYCERIDWRRESFLGYWVDGELRAIGELKPDGGAWFTDAEVALSVEEPWQNQDIGTELLKRLATIARNRLIGALRLVCLPRNHKMMHLVRKLNANLMVEPAQADARIPLATPTQLTMLLELLDDASGFLGSFRSQDEVERLAS